MAAGRGPPLKHELISLLALNRLRVSEATSADIEHLGLEGGHRALTIIRKGGKVVTIPLAPRTVRAIDLAFAAAGRRQSAGPSASAACQDRFSALGHARNDGAATRREGSNDTTNGGSALTAIAGLALTAGH